MGKVGKATRHVLVAAIASVAALTFVGIAAAEHTTTGDGVAPTVAKGTDAELGTCATAAAAEGNNYTLGLKVDQGGANPVPNGTFSSGPLTVTISGSTGTEFDWSSNIPINAVYVKSGPGALLFSYPSGDTGDTNLYGPGHHGISHVLFCYAPPPPRLTVTKTANPSYKLTHSWDVEKMANPTAQTVAVGSSGATTWTVVLDGSTAESEWAVGGSITVTNESTISAMVALSDTLPGASVTLELGCSSFALAAGASRTCAYAATFASDPGDGSLTNTAQATAEGFQAGTGTATFSFANAPFTEVNKEVNLSDGQAPGGTFANPYSADATITYLASYPCSEPGSRTISNTAVVRSHPGGTMLDQDTATYTLTCQTTPPPPSTPSQPVAATPTIDLSITKVDTPDPLAVNGTLTYTISVVNSGPSTATNVTVTDPIPGAMSYQSATASQGTCTGGQQLACNLGTLAIGASATITVTVRATQAGTFTNTATVKGDQPEPNLANNTASAQTTVTAPLSPPTARPKPQPKPAVCYAFTVTPKALSVGRKGTIVVKVTLRGKAIKNARVVVRGSGIDRSGRTDARGIARITISPLRAGILRITVPNRASCTAKRIGVAGAFEPPVTG